MKSAFSARSMATCAMVASIYIVLCLFFAPVSFGLIQFRIAEALTLLAIFSTDMVLAVTIGCAVANLLGFMLGVNPLILDIFFGTFATAIAGVLSWKLRNYRFKNIPILSTLPPVIVNAFVIGGEITLLETGKIFGSANIFIINATYIGLSQIIPCMILGPLLILLLEKTGLSKKYLMEVS